MWENGEDKLFQLNINEQTTQRTDIRHLCTSLIDRMGMTKMFKPPNK